MPNAVARDGFKAWGCAGGAGVGAGVGNTKGQPATALDAGGLGAGGGVA